MVVSIIIINSILIQKVIREYSLLNPEIKVHFHAFVAREKHKRTSAYVFHDFSDELTGVFHLVEVGLRLEVEFECWSSWFEAFDYGYVKLFLKVYSMFVLQFNVKMGS